MHISININFNYVFFTLQQRPLFEFSSDRSSLMPGFWENT